MLIECGTEASMGFVMATLPRFGVTSKAMLNCTKSGVIQVALPKIMLNDEHEVMVWWPRGYGGQYLYDLMVGCYVL